LREFCLHFGLFYNREVVCPVCVCLVRRVNSFFAEVSQYFTCCSVKNLVKCGHELMNNLYNDVGVRVDKVMKRREEERGRERKRERKRERER